MNAIFKEDTLVNVPEFAKLKDVSTQAVWNAINNKRLPVTVIGMNKNHVFICTRSNKKFNFDHSKKHR